MRVRRRDARRADALLRRRHERLRRHGADPADLRARRRGAADRRPLHDGATRGRRRRRAHRCDARHPESLRHLPAADRNARGAAQTCCPPRSSSSPRPRARRSPCDRARALVRGDRAARFRRVALDGTVDVDGSASSSTTSPTSRRCAPPTQPASRSSCAPARRGDRGGSRAARGLVRARHRPGRCSPSTSPITPMGSRPVVATYSICACDLDAGQWGVATQSKFLAVGSVVPWAAPQVGAIATQSYANPRYGPDGLAPAADGCSADEVVERLTAADDDREQRQLGVVDAAGRGATFTGSECHTWAGGRAGDGYAAQGNILVSAATVDALVDTFLASAGRPLAERLLDCLAAAQAAGGDRRGQQSAALLVVERDGGYAGLSDTLVDLRIDDHERTGRGAAAALPPSSRAVRQDAPRGLASRRRCAPCRDRRAPRSPRPRDARRLGRGREPRGARRRQRPRSIRSCWQHCGTPHDASASGSCASTRSTATPTRARPRWHMIRTMLGIESFGINAWRATEAGQEIIGEHDELGDGAGGHEELYLVLAGRATFTIDGERSRGARRARSSTSRIRGARRSAVADEAVDDDPRRRRPARERLRGLAVGALGGGASVLDDRRVGSRDRGPRGATCRGSRATPTSSTTSPAPRVAAADRTAALDASPARDRARAALRERTPGTIPTSPRSATTSGSRPAEALAPSYAVARQADARGAARGSRAPGSYSGRATSRTAPCSGPASAPTRSSSPTARANALCALGPPNGHELLGRGEPGEHVAVGDRSHRDVDDDRRALTRTGCAIASGFVPVSGVDAVGMSESTAARWPSAVRSARPARRAAAPSSRARRSGSSAWRRRASPSTAVSAMTSSQIACEGEVAESPVAVPAIETMLAEPVFSGRASRSNGCSSSHAMRE